MTHSVIMRNTLFISIFWGCVFLGGTTACDKKCQAPPEKPLTTFIGLEWRLVSTTDPGATKNLSRFTFLILIFKLEFEGEIYKVENNKRFDSPVGFFKFNVQSEGRSGSLFTVDIAPPPPDDGSGANTSTTTSQSKTVKRYEYEWGNRLNITESKTGYEYEYVPFTGIIDPDSTCTF